MKKEDVLIRYLVLGILICVAAGVLCLAAADMSLFGSTGRRGILYNEDLITFNRDWTVSAYGYGEYQPEDLPYRGKFPSGTFVTLVNTLPYSVKEGTYVAFRNMYCVCDVYIGDELIYSSPAYVSAYRTFPVPGWVFVPLTEEYSARTISIVMKSPYRFVPVTVPVMLLGTHAEVLLYSRDSGYFDLYVAVTVAVLGLIVMLFAAFNMTASGSRRACVFTGLCMTALGAALMIGTGIARMSESADFMEYMIGRLIFLLCPVLYSSSMCAESPEGKRKKISTVLAAVSFCCFILCVMSHYLGLADLTATSFAARILMLLILGTDLYFTLKGASAAGIYYRIATAAGTAALAAETVMGCMPGFEVYALFTHVRYLLVMLFALSRSACVVISSYREATGREVMARELAESRLKLMMSQIQPHFIHNTLSTIRAMISEDPDRAYDMVYDFADYLRYNINSLGNVPIIPFEEELKHIKAYTDIESQRYGDRVKIAYDIQDVSFSIPPLSVQPLVENAVKHGVCRKLEGGTVRISSFLSEEGHTVKVEDDGAGFDVSVLHDPDTRGVGIKNAVYRLENQVDARVDIKSVPGEGTKVTIIIPAERRSADEDDTRG